MLASLLVVSCGNDSVRFLPEDVLFQESFVAEEAGQWVLEADESGRATLKDGRLLIEVDAPHTVQYVALSEPAFDDFTAEVEIVQTAGHEESSAGLIFRMISPDQFYRFEITSTGMYMVERRNADATWTRFVDDWTDAPEILQGLQQTNRLKVVAEGATLGFYVNDALLLEAIDSSYDSGNLALSAGTFGRPGLQVAFDNVLVRKP